MVFISALSYRFLFQGSRKYFDSADELAKAAAASAAAVVAPVTVGTPAHAGPVAARASAQSLGSSFDAASVPPPASAAGADVDNAAPLPALAIAAAPRGSLTGGTAPGLAAAAAASASSHSGARILIVDHIEASARMMQISLTHAKFAVDVCATGEEMIARAHSYRAVLFSMQVCVARWPILRFALLVHLLAPSKSERTLFSTARICPPVQFPDMSAIEAIRRVRASEADGSAAASSSPQSQAAAAGGRAPVLLFGIGSSSKVTAEELSAHVEAGLDGHMYSGSIIAKVCFSCSLIHSQIPLLQCAVSICS